MILRITYKVIIVLLFAVTTGFVSVSVNPCLDKLMYVARAKTELGSKERIKLNISTEIVYRDSLKMGKKQKSTQLYEAGAGLIHYKNEQTEYWQNDTEVIIVMPYQKSVVVAQVTAEAREQFKKSSVFPVADSLMKNATVLTCEKSTDKNPVSYMKLKLPGKSGAEVGIQYMEFWIDTKINKVIKSKFVYEKNSPYESIVSIYSNFESSKPISNKVNIRKNVFDTKGNLLKKYQTYKVINNSKK